MTRSATRLDYQQRILRVLTYIQKHLDDAIAPLDLAQVACFSPHHFHRIFRGMVGESVMGHIRRLRVERAAWRLKFGDWPITRIAFEAGYESHQAFTRSFGAYFGISPSAFRAKHRAIEFPASPSGVHFQETGEVTRLKSSATDRRGLAVKVLHFETRPVAFVRHLGPYDAVGKSWDTLMMWAAQQGWIGPAQEMLGLCYDDPDIVPPERIRYEACLVVKADFEPQGEIGKQEVPAGEFAVVRHRGPYKSIADAYLRLLGHWLPVSGRRAASGACLEVYWNDPESTEPKDLETDVCLRLVPEGAA